MRLIKMAALVAVSFMLSGCATNHKYRVAPWPWTGVSPCTSTTQPGVPVACDANHALVAYVRANEFCRKMQDYYAAGGLYAESGKLAISTIGAVAGSVIAPIASGTAATAWSGVSGVSNGLQTQMNQAFSEAVEIQRRASIAEAARDGAEAYGSANATALDRVVAAVDMARGCALNVAIADRATMQALVQAPKVEIPKTPKLQPVTPTVAPPGGPAGVPTPSATP